MKIRFLVEYLTQWGQNLLISGSVPALGSWSPAEVGKMSHTPEGFWTYDIEIDPLDPAPIYYRYILNDERYGCQFHENGAVHIFNPAEYKSDIILLRDTWRSKDMLKEVFHSQTFSGVLFKPEAGKAVKTTAVNRLVFKVDAPRIQPGHQVFVSGDIPELGNWDESKLVLLDNVDYPVWKASIAQKGKYESFSYKYGIYDPIDKRIVAWETNENRKFVDASLAGACTIVCDDYGFHIPAANWKGAGVAIPVFSLRTKSSFGIGEFDDLKALVDWSVVCGVKMIQILPINDTSSTFTKSDSYPYSAISVFALHPIYVNLFKVGKLADAEKQAFFEAEQKRLNAFEDLQYEEVIRLKNEYLRLYFDENKAAILKNKAFRKFVDDKKEWLLPYAAYCLFRDKYKTCDYDQWEENAAMDLDKLEKLGSEKSTYYPELAFHYFVQFNLHNQLLEASDYAHGKRIVIKGDIPIGISRYSVDTWLYPNLFDINSQAGAPPDDFAISGQNWGFPTYKWAEMAKDGYLWWQKRFQNLSQYFDAFRIDHILGFFRIWEIPSEHVEGLMGHFNPTLPIHRSEVEWKGLWFDYDRFCKPYIRSYMLGDIFGEYADEVRIEFLEEYQYEHFNLKEQFATQVAIDKYLAPRFLAEPENTAKWERIKLGLFKLVAEVLFLEVPGSNKELFNPRISIHATYSYQALDDWKKHLLNELYLDYYYHRNDNFWRQKANEKIPGISRATNMLICGEDLGMVPACVPEVMSESNILSLEIQRMPKDSKIEFGIPYHYPYFSVCSPSSHDMSNIRGWWTEDRTKIQRFYNYVMHRYGEAPAEAEPWLVSDIVWQHLASNSMWAVFPLQDFTGCEESVRRADYKAEQINVPSDPNHYWKYRFHLNIEDLVNYSEFNELIGQMIKESGRNTVY